MPTAKTQNPQEEKEDFFDKGKAIRRIAEYIISSIIEDCENNPDIMEHECILSFADGKISNYVLNFYMSICSDDELIDLYEELDDDDIEKIKEIVNRRLNKSIELLCSGGSGVVSKTVSETAKKIDDILVESEKNKLCCEYYGEGDCEKYDED